MNPMTNMKNVKKLSEQELQRNFKTSWHDQYRSSAWIFVGGLPYDLTEGDILCVFSQYGEVVNLNLVRDKDTGKQKGFCFICYEDQRSTDLAVDNFNGIKILGRTIRVDHVTSYKMPKDKKTADSETRKLQEEGCGPNVKLEKRPQMPIPSTELPEFAKEKEAPPDGFRLPPRLPIGTIKIEKEDEESTSKVKVKKEKKQKKDKKKKKSKKKRKKKQVSSSESSSDSSEDSSSEDESSSDDEEKHSKKKSKKEKKKPVSDSDDGKNNKSNKNSKDDENIARTYSYIENAGDARSSEEQREERKYYNSREDYLKHRGEDKQDEKRNYKYDEPKNYRYERKYERDEERRYGDYDKPRRNDYERDDRKREYDRRDRDDSKRYRR